MVRKKSSLTSGKKSNAAKKRKEKSQNLDEDEADLKREIHREDMAKSRAKMSQEKRDEVFATERGRQKLHRVGLKKEYQKVQRSTSVSGEISSKEKIESRAKSDSRSIVQKFKDRAKRIIDGPVPPPSKKRQVGKLA